MRIFIEQRRIFAIFSVVALATVLIVLQFLGEHVRDLLIWKRDAISHLELWRVFTAHFVHLTWIHLAVNLLGYGLLVVLYGNIFGRKELVLTIFFLAGALGCELYFLSDIDWYLGWSGILIGLYIYFAMAKIKLLPLQGLIIFLVIAYKIAREQWLSIHTVEWLRGQIPVAIDAHLLGAATGLALALISSNWLIRAT